MSEFATFLDTMRGRQVLHIGHREADCDALGSAYAMSRLLPGDVGFAHGIRTAAQDLADWLELDWVRDPDPAAYEYTIIYDTLNLGLLGVPLPPRYALFDHHQDGGHRYAVFHNELAGEAEWAWVRSTESTCSLLVDLFQANGIPLEPKTAVALAAGIVTDTAWLKHAGAGALGRLATLLAVSGLYVEDILAAVDSPASRAARRPAVLDAVRRVEERQMGDWSLLSTLTDSHDHGFAVVTALHQLGGDVRAVGFPRGAGAMVMVECSSALVEEADLDLAGLMAGLAQVVRADETWGTRAMGRIVAALPAERLLEMCVAVVVGTLAPSVRADRPPPGRGL